MRTDDDGDNDTASDEDFVPEAQAVEDDDDDVSSSSADEAGGTVAKKQGSQRVRKHVDIDLDSGDEATIQELKKKKRRRHKNANPEEAQEDEDLISDEDGGEGGFVRTRAQRRTEKIERKALASTKGATLDVDAAWTRLAAIPVGRVHDTSTQDPENEEDYITIKRTTKFAGEVTTEEKRVLKSSKEAKIWLDEQETAKKKDIGKENDAPAEPESAIEAEDDDATGKTSRLPLRRPLKRPLKWDPNPTGEVKGLPPNLQLRWPRDKLLPNIPTEVVIGAVNHRALPKLPAAAKLNTVQKSKYDWASYVDKNKLAEELDEYGRSKESYAGRTDFLNRLEQRQEEGRLKAKSKAAG